MRMTARAIGTCAALALAGCDLHHALMGFPEPTVSVEGASPVELAYREGPGGLVLAGEFTVS